MSATLSTSPIIHCENPNWDWGTLLEGEAIEHTFKIANEGNTPLKISSVRSGCGCTTVNFTKIIPPGKIGEVAIKLRIRGIRRKITKKIRVYSNDPIQMQLLLIMSGNIKSVFKLVPAYSYLEGLRGTTVSTTIKMKRNLPGNLEILSAKADRFIYDLKTIKKGEEYELTLKLENTKELYSTSENISFSVKLNEKIVEVPLRVMLRLRNAVNVSPNFISFRPVNTKKNKLLSKTLLVKGWNGNKFKITNVEVKPKNPAYWTKDKGEWVSPVKVHIESDEKANGHRIRVELLNNEAPKGRPGSLEVLLHTDDELTPKIAIPVKIYTSRDAFNVAIRFRIGQGHCCPFPS